MNKHTPGPWEIVGMKKEPQTVGAIVSYHSYRDGKYVCGMSVCIYGEEAEANARLIAAAPDLLAACERALEKLNLIGGLPATIRVLQEAISKAKGED
jgi:hypothetical protein